MSNYQLKNLKHHCFDLAYFFFNLQQIKVDMFHNPNYSYWLHLASSIDQLKLDSGKLGIGPKGVIDLSQSLYLEAEQKNAEIVRSLVIFKLNWHTFELLSADYFSEDNQTHLNNLTDFLDQAYNPYKNLTYFNEVVSDLKRMIRQSQILDRKRALHHITQEKRTSVGIRLVERIKDNFAHVAYQFPLGSDPSGPDSINPEIIDLSSRIVLLTLQMIMLPYFEEHSELSIICWWYADEPKRRMPVHAFLRTVHLTHSRSTVI